jgi:hypothetical protein
MATEVRHRLYCPYCRRVLPHGQEVCPRCLAVEVPWPEGNGGPYACGPDNRELFLTVAQLAFQQALRLYGPPPPRTR